MNRSRAGQTLAEFALVIPILLLILIGLVDIGRGVFIASSLTNSAREGARFAAVNQDKVLVTQRVLEQIQIALPTVTVNYFQPLTNPAADPSGGGTCGAFDGNGHVTLSPSVGCVAVVALSYSFQPITPLIGQLIGTINLSSKSISSVEFSCPDPGRLGFPFPTAADCPRN